MSQTGRYFIKDKKTGKVFCIEPLENGIRKPWGDQNPATKKLEGKYGDKHKGCINEKESIINEKNGFKNITYLEPGESPDSFIDKILNT